MSEQEENDVLVGIMNFQQEMEGVEIIKATKAYGYYYATLDDIMRIIKPIMLRKNIWFQHEIAIDKENGKNYLITYIYHVLNNESRVYARTLIDGDTVLAKMNKFMVEGSGITYFRRYHMTTLLGLTTDEDTDAAGKKVDPKQGNTGRSVESTTSSESGPNFLNVFENLLKTKTEVQINKTFNVYKSQMNKEEILAVNELINKKFNK